MGRPCSPGKSQRRTVCQCHTNLPSRAPRRCCWCRRFRPVGNSRRTPQSSSCSRYQWGIPLDWTHIARTGSGSTPALRRDRCCHHRCSTPGRCCCSMRSTSSRWVRYRGRRWGSSLYTPLRRSRPRTHSHCRWHRSSRRHSRRRCRDGRTPLRLAGRSHSRHRCPGKSQDRCRRKGRRRTRSRRLPERM